MTGAIVTHQNYLQNSLLKENYYDFILVEDNIKNKIIKKKL